MNPTCPQSQSVAIKKNGHLHKEFAVSLKSACPRVLHYLDKIIKELQENLFVGAKTNPPWLWLVFHRQSRQVLAMHVGKRTGRSAELLLKKQPEDLKKESFTQISSLYTSMFFGSMDCLEKGQGRQTTLSGLTTLSGKDVLVW